MYTPRYSSRYFIHTRTSAAYTYYMPSVYHTVQHARTRFEHRVISYKLVDPTFNPVQCSDRKIEFFHLKREWFFFSLRFTLKLLWLNQYFKRHNRFEFTVAVWNNSWVPSKYDPLLLLCSKLNMPIFSIGPIKLLNYKVYKKKKKQNVFYRYALL